MASFLPPIKKQDEMIMKIAELAAVARKDGMIALEAKMSDIFRKRPSNAR